MLGTRTTRTSARAMVLLNQAALRTILGACLAVASSAGVEVASGDDELVDLARQAKNQFRPVTADDTAAAREELLGAIQRLDAFLAGGPASYAEGWKGYLRWEKMMAAVADPEAVDREALQLVAQRYYRNVPGLEMTYFSDVRDALVDYWYAVTNASNADLEAEYQARLDQLIELLPAYAANPTAEARRQIGQTMGWLHRAGQAGALVAAIGEQYQQPNLFASISQRLAASGFQTAVTEQTDVRDVILGTSITGQATMNGRTDLQFAANPQRASLQLLLQGTVHSDNVGYNRGVTILSRGTTTVSARKPLYVAAEGISAGAAAAHCCTATRITGICARSCLVERIARKRVARSKGQAESIASRRAEGRIAKQMDAEAQELLAKAEEAYQTKFRHVLQRRGEFPRLLRYHTQAARLFVTWQQANPAQLGAPGAPPELTADSDLTVRLHESFVSNFSRALIGGFTLTDERLAKILQDTTGNVPEELQIQPDKPPWSITFSSNEPVSAVFADDRIRFAIRGRQFTSGNQTVGGDPGEPEVELSAEYELEKTPTGAHLKRVGDVRVRYLGAGEKLSTKQVTVRAVMRAKFEALFAAEFVTDGIKLPGRWEQGGKLQLEQMASRQGWLRLGWLKREAPAAEVASRN